jgi:Ser-tRNA(Ala) deacylase AlaX
VGRLIDVVVPCEGSAARNRFCTKERLVPESVREMRVVECEGFDAQMAGGAHRRIPERGRLRMITTENNSRLDKRLETTFD